MSLNLKPEDIDTIEEAGMLDGQPIKLCRTKGGLWLAAGSKGMLTAGSHPAIVKHQLTRMFPKFQPSMCKSENFSDSLVEKHSHFLSDDLRKSGHDLFSIQDGSEIEFQITKHNIAVASLNTYLQNNSLHVPSVNFPKQFSRAMAGATTEKAIACNSTTIKIK